MWKGLERAEEIMAVPFSQAVQRREAWADEMNRKSDKIMFNGVFIKLF